MQFAKRWARVTTEFRVEFNIFSIILELVILMLKFPPFIERLRKKDFAVLLSDILVRISNNLKERSLALNCSPRSASRANPDLMSRPKPETQPEGTPKNIFYLNVG